MSGEYPELLTDILGGWRHGARGPLPQITGLQVLAALILIRDGGPLGRRALSQALQIKSGVARGLLERLAEHDIVVINDDGASISKTGSKTLDNELETLGIRKIQDLHDMGLVPGKKGTAIHIAGCYREGLNGISERDEAVRAGADGTIIIVMLDGKLVIPPDNKDVRDMSVSEDSRFRQLFHPSEKDLIVVGFSDNTGPALAGALAAAASIARR